MRLRTAIPILLTAASVMITGLGLAIAINIAEPLHNRVPAADILRSGVFASILNDVGTARGDHDVIERAIAIKIGQAEGCAPRTAFIGRRCSGRRIIQPEDVALRGKLEKEVRCAGKVEIITS